MSEAVVILICVLSVKIKFKKHKINSYYICPVLSSWCPYCVPKTIDNLNKFVVEITITGSSLVTPCRHNNDEVSDRSQGTCRLPKGLNGNV